jgi:phosphoenolpyruvate-protein phosphotransferase (PTS system enzyme I)
MLRGTPVSSGIAQGKAFVLACADQSAGPLRNIQPAQLPEEMERFDTAVARAEAELNALTQTVGQRLGRDEGDIFVAQALVLRDPSFRQQVTVILREKLVNVEAALSEVIERVSRRFDEIPDAYLRERAADIRDVGRRVLEALLEAVGGEKLRIPEGSVVVADELLPSVTANLELGQVRGFITHRGGRFSHSSILARSMGTPAVTGISQAPHTIRTGDQVIVDGVTGVVFVNPEPRVRQEYDRLEEEFKSYRQALQQILDQPSITVDGTAVSLMANVSKFPDTEAAALYRAEGIGLYRTEFGFSVRNTFPTEDEQYEFLAKAAQRLHPRPVTFRLLDLGGDKQLSYFPLPSSRNPSLADRGVRLLLKHPALLQTQLRAFLRVSADHPVRVLLPVVGGVTEVRQVKAVIAEVKRQLAAEGQRFDPNVPVGAMIEIPSAALLADALAAEVDFFSLGTNDLVQYLLAADREDEGPEPYYQPLHPAVLRLIRSLTEAAERCQRPLTICGEMAGEPRYAELLLGLGLRGFSVAPGEILPVKDAIRKASLPAAQTLARDALALSTHEEVEALLAANSKRVDRPGDGRSV